jgi:isopentenyl diphosphate isomerase/L-lactate dehydrogenase-like FMN-dependent dehydrogenase
MEVYALREFEALARDRLTPEAYAYYAGGSFDEQTLRENEAAFARRTLRPRVLVDVSRVDLATTMLGTPVAAPFGLAPVALLGLAHPEGEAVAARAAAKAHLIFCLSTFASRSIETVAAVGRGTRWFQLYVLRDRAGTRRLVERAVAGAFRALVVTVDLAAVGYREREMRQPLPATVARDGGVLESDEVFGEAVGAAVDPSLDWDDLAWLRSLSDLPLVVKGILSGEDAERAVEAGAAGIVVSNHGGRQLDRVPASIDALGEVISAVGGRAEVYLDGGVRRGTDVATALALGARACFIGRPFVYALAAGGEAGLQRAVEILTAELTSAMALLGAPTVRELTRDRVG